MLLALAHFKGVMNIIYGVPLNIGTPVPKGKIMEENKEVEELARLIHSPYTHQEYELAWRIIKAGYTRSFGMSKTTSQDVKECPICHGEGWYALQPGDNEQEQRQCDNCDGGKLRPSECKPTSQDVTINETCIKCGKESNLVICDECFNKSQDVKADNPCPKCGLLYCECLLPLDCKPTTGKGEIEDIIEILNKSKTHFLHYHDKEGGRISEGQGVFPAQFDCIAKAICQRSSPRSKGELDEKSVELMLINFIGDYMSRFATRTNSKLKYG